MTKTDDIIHRALTFPMDEVLQRYAAQDALPMNVVREHERELKRFLIICAITSDAKIGMKGPIDKLWHAFILFTKLYAEFCETVAGRFIHHFPIPTGNNEKNRSRLGYRRFYRAYITTFGETPPSAVWPVLQGGDDDGGGGSGDCGGGGDCHQSDCHDGCDV